MRRAIQQFKEANGRGFILDLRNNPGGLLSAVVSVSDLFLDGGVVLYEIDAQGDQTDYDASGGGPASEIPMVVAHQSVLGQRQRNFGGGHQNCRAGSSDRRDHLRQGQRQHHARVVGRVGHLLYGSPVVPARWNANRGTGGYPYRRVRVRSNASYP